LWSGLLRPGETHKYRAEVGAHEKVVAFGPDRAFQIDTPPGEVVITNVTGQMAPYVVGVVPTVLAAVAAVPWGKVVRQIRSRPDGLAVTLNQLIATVANRLQPRLQRPPDEDE